MFSALLIPLLTGCAPTGIWMLTIPFVEGEVEECLPELDENFQDGYEDSPDVGPTDSDWTVTESMRGADSIMFIQTEPTSGGGAVLMVNNSAYPGVASDGGWTFEWKVDTLAEYEAEHKDGYIYSTMEKSVVTTTIEFMLPLFGDATGTIGGSSSSEREWVESDAWDGRDTGVQLGQIPSDLYLVYKEGDNLMPQRNDPKEADCQDSECYISISQNCPGASSDFTAKKVEDDTDNSYDSAWSDNRQ